MYLAQVKLSQFLRMLKKDGNVYVYISEDDEYVDEDYIENIDPRLYEKVNKYDVYSINNEIHIYYKLRY